MNKINMLFFNAYLELDKACAQRLEVSRGGASAYINMLAELRFAPERSEVLPKLLKYRKLRNIIAHEEGVFSEIDEITKADIKWLNSFTRSVNKRRDPISRYERKAKIYAVWSKVKIVLGVMLLLALALAVVSIAKQANM
jgi:hypothetical protein